VWCARVTYRESRILIWNIIWLEILNWYTISSMITVRGLAFWSESIIDIRNSAVFQTSNGDLLFVHRFCTVANTPSESLGAAHDGEREFNQDLVLWSTWML